MQITRVHIQNYKSLYDVPIDGLKPLTIFVGPNDSGKSAILQSILLSGGVDEREWRSLVPAFSEVISHGRQSEPVRLELHLTLDDFARSTLFDAVAELSRDPLDWRLDPHLAAAFDRRLFQHIQCLFVWGGEGAPELQKLETTLPDATQAMLRQIVPGHGVIVDLPLGYILDNRDNLESALKTGSGAQQTGGPLLSTWLISRFKERLAFIHGTRRPAGQGELVVSPTLERDGSNLLAVLSHLRDHDSRAFDAVLRVMPRLVVEAGQIGFRPRERLQSLVFEVARQIEEGLDHKGAGVGDLLVLVTGILSKSHSITLLEEPEAHLHPGAQREFVAWLRELADGGRQFIMTTHSPALLGAVGSLEIWPKSGG